MSVRRPAPEKKTTTAATETRIAILNRIPVEAMGQDDQLFLLRLMRELALDGHRAFFVDFPKGKGADPSLRLAGLVRDNEADLWLINAGTAEILSWFERSGVTALAMGGQFRGIPIPIVYATMRPAVAEATARLVALGHTRIVLLVPATWRQSPCHSAVMAFREGLEAAGIRVGAYHLPEWRETPEGLATLLDDLFRLTPPTAILCFEGNSPHGVLMWLARRGLNIPRDVSVVSCKPDPGTAWASPGTALAHCSGEDEPGIRKVLRWVDDAIAGNIRRAAVEVTFRFFPGDSIGPAPGPVRK